jgi:hypothetical protein
MSEASPDHDEFFIGYEPVSPAIGRRLVLIAAGVAVAALGVSAVAAVGHVPLEGGRFAFGHPTPLAGRVAAMPYPGLHLDVDPAGPAVLVVGTGKHGASLPGAGHRVQGMGTRIERDGLVMMEILPGGLVDAPGSDGATADSSPPADVRLRGEIVDSKCFLGVMVPGAGTTHRECASLCIRGGIPPALFVEDRAGRTALLLLAAADAEALRTRAEALAGSPVDVTGVVTRRAGWLVLATDPSSWTPLVR